MSVILLELLLCFIHHLSFVFVFQDSNLSDCNSEILSSKDSLENEEPNPGTKNLQCSNSSFSLNSMKSHPDPRKQSDLYPTSDLIFSACLGDNLLQSGKLHEPEQNKQAETERPNNKMHWGFTAEQKSRTETQPALNNCNLLTFCEVFNAYPEDFERNFPQNSPSDKLIVTNRVKPGSTVLESSCPKQEALFHPRHQTVPDDRQLRHPSATAAPLPSKNSNSKDILFGAPAKPNISLNNSTTYNGSQAGTLQQTGKQNHYLSSRKEPSVSINNLNKVSNSEPKTEKPINTAQLQHTCLSNIHSDCLRCLHCPEERQTPHSVCTVRYVKGILKKQPKYMSGDTKCMYGSRHVIFGNQVAFEIRDSVELTRAKTKDVEGDNLIKKKLRWFDEVHEEEEDKEYNIMKQMKDMSSSLSQSKNNSEDHQLSVTTVSGVSKPGPIMTPAASTGYHFTKQAWADVGVQVSLPHEQADEVKVPRTGGPKVPRRERSARVGAGPVSSQSRKGLVIRPQSATAVSQIAKTQGKLMVPRPPPRMESVEEKMVNTTKTPYGTDHASVNCKQAVAVEQFLHKDNSEGFFSPYTHVVRTNSTVPYTPLPPSYAFPVSEGSTKGMPSSGPQHTHGCSRRRGMVFSEKGLCLDYTPTDEEISQLWDSVRSALATKDGKPMLRSEAPESGRHGRKPCVEQSRQLPGPGNRRLPQPSQPTKKTTEPVRPFSSTYNMAFADEGLDSAGYLHLARVHAEGLLEEKRTVAAMETAQTQPPALVQQCSQHQGLTTISLEEHKILLSLDRLNHQLHCVQEHVGGNTGTRGLILIEAPSTKEMKVTKRCASSANNRFQYQKKF
uniref:Uncharacterized protein n=1 Tax=Monopterus albus TaxID=43700 RepID=A0A3Q3J7B8_MONAL